MLSPGSSAAFVAVNNQQIREPVVLSPGDRIMLGGVPLLLHGLTNDQIQPTLDHIMQDLRSKPRPFDEKSLAKGIASILQCHWQRQRIGMIEKRRNTVEKISCSSSESSVVQRISDSDLHQI